MDYQPAEANARPGPDSQRRKFCSVPDGETVKSFGFKLFAHISGPNPRRKGTDHQFGHFGLAVLEAADFKFWRQSVKNFWGAQAIGPPSRFGAYFGQEGAELNAEFGPRGGDRCDRSG